MAQRSCFWKDACVLGGDDDDTVDLSSTVLCDLRAGRLVAAVRRGAKRVLLRHAEMPGASAALLARAFLPTGSGCSVSRLDLSYARVGPPQLCALLTALRTNTTVTALSLEDVGMADEDSLVPILIRSDSSALRHLILASNKLGPSWGEVMSSALQQNTQLHTLDLRCNELGTEGGVAVLEAVARHPCLTSVSLSHNDIGSAAATPIGEAVTKCKTLFSLSIDGAHLPDEHATAPLVRALRDTAHLRELSLASCGMGPAAAEPLVDALSDASLWAVSVDHNPIGDDVTAQLLSLPVAGRLRWLHAAHTGSGEQCRQRLPALVENAAELRGIAVGGVSVDCVSIADVITRGCFSMSLRALSLRRAVDVGDAGVAVLGHALRRATNLEALVLDQVDLHSEGFAGLCMHLSAPTSTTRLVQLEVSGNPVAATSKALAGLSALFKRQPCLAAVRAANTALAVHFQTPELDRKLVSDSLCDEPLPDTANLRSSAFLSQGCDVMHWPGDPRGTITYRPTALFFGSSGVEDPRDWPVDDGLPPPPPVRPRSASFDVRMLHEHKEDIMPLPDLDVSLGRKYKVRDDDADGDGREARLRGPAGRLERRRLEKAGAVGGVVLTEEHLRRAFKKLDVNGDCVVDIEEFKAFMDSDVGKWNPTWDQEKVDDALKRTGVLSDGVLTFDEFAVLMLQLTNL